MSLPVIATPVSLAPVRPWGTRLRDLHNRRLRELRSVLEPARAPEAGVWSRWGALKSIKRLFTGWFVPERAAVEGAGSHLMASQTSHLWVEAELIALLEWQLDHAVGLIHCPAEFARITLKLETVLEHWCREVEDALARLDDRDFSDEQRHAFEVFIGEESHHVI